MGVSWVWSLRRSGRLLITAFRSGLQRSNSTQSLGFLSLRPRNKGDFCAIKPKVPLVKAFLSTCGLHIVLTKPFSPEASYSPMNAERLALLQRRRKEKLKLALLQCFGAFSLNAVERAMEQAEELFELYHEDFKAVYRVLCASISAALPSASPLPSQPSNWKGLISHQAQVHRLFAVDQNLHQKQQKQLYKEELDRQIETRKAAQRRETTLQTRSNLKGTGKHTSSYGESGLEPLGFVHFDAEETRRRQVELI